MSEADPLDLPVASLGEMSIRLENILGPRCENIKTVRELTGRTAQQLMRAPGMGKVTLGELKRLLADKGLALTEAPARNGTPPLPFPSINDRLQRIERRLDSVERHPLLRVVGDMTVHDGEVEQEDQTQDR